MFDSLEAMLDSLDGYDSLPETWRVPEIRRFSSQKNLYKYQEVALQNAARALYRYYRGSNGWHPNETQSAVDKRNRDFMDLYYTRVGASQMTWNPIKKYLSDRDRKSEKQNAVFKVFSEFVSTRSEAISYHHFINRMCFWMATGSGKTLVMIKLIEYLHSLKRHGEIPHHNILILAPSDHLIGQIRRTIDEFNRNGGLHMEMVPLRQAGRNPYQEHLGDATIVYYHRSDNISDVQKDALTDYRRYENDGKWYVFLDEAHKGGKDESKRQAYYALMARAGFLFNFSATFTDKVDIVTTIKKYNLEEFTKHGYGKNIYLSGQEYVSFKNKTQEIGPNKRREIVLKSLITLAHASMRVEELREKTGFSEMYHRPLMMTLVNSVNTAIENDQNDLWTFFQTLREIATGELEASAFKNAKTELLNEWKQGKPFFGGDGDKVIGAEDRSVMTMKITDLRAHVFLSRRKSALQLIRSGDNKELAFQMKNADAPFALIRIGDTSKWRGRLLARYEETDALQKKSFFDDLEKSPITILMGSRAFFESWDLNRPNVINYINIGGIDAKKFVVQSIGRGVRIETLPGKRGRIFRHDFVGEEKKKVAQCQDLQQPPETLYVFATNRAAVQSVLQGLAMEKSPAFEELDGIERMPAPKIGNEDMPLLVPVYRDDDSSKAKPGKFAVSEESLSKLKILVENTSDSVFTVRDGLNASDISELRSITAISGKIQIAKDKHYFQIPFLQHRLVSHLSKKPQISDSVRNLCEEDIVHFRNVRAHPEHAAAIQSLIKQVKQGRASDKLIGELYRRFQAGEMTKEQFFEQASDEDDAGHDEASYLDELRIKRLANHYYSPVILGKETSDYIRHIIKVESEVNFLNDLEDWMGELPLDKEHNERWDAWMFSKLDESLDRNIYILYFDSQTNKYRRFQPDFIFWMCNGKSREYRILFVDPKGGEHADAYRKIDGYQRLFEEDGESNSNRKFSYGRWKVSVDLLMYNSGLKSAPLDAYKAYWAVEPSDVFKAES